jgi:hypothetical protein
MARSVLSLSFGLAVVAARALAEAGCDQLDDFLDGVHGRDGGGGAVACGKATCAAGQVCCNASCGICTPPGGVCTQQVCDDPPPATCRTAADCRLFSDYCTGCDCRALATGAADPTCNGPGVQCLIDPCDGKSAVCTRGACVVAGP